jgi:hypothetical protein
MISSLTCQVVRVKCVPVVGQDRLGRLAAAHRAISIWSPIWTCVVEEGTRRAINPMMDTRLPVVVRVLSKQWELECCSWVFVANMGEASSAVRPWSTMRYIALRWCGEECTTRILLSLLYSRSMKIRLVSVVTCLLIVAGLIFSHGRPRIGEGYKWRMSGCSSGACDSALDLDTLLGSYCLSHREAFVL